MHYTSSPARSATHTLFTFSTPPSIPPAHEFKNYYRIFTDGSKEGKRVAAAVVHRDNTKCVQLPDAASIFRAELYALLLAIDVEFCNLF